MKSSNAQFRIIDLHADLLLDVVTRRKNGERGVLERYHLSKLRQGLVSTVIAAIWVESIYKPTRALKRGLQILDAFREDLNESPDFRLVRTYQDFLDAERDGKIGLILGVEGGELIEDDLGLLRNFHRLGVRNFGLVWGQRNLMADGSDHYKDDRGLTDFGRQVVEELGRLKIVVDLAHIPPKGFWSVLEVAKHPLIVSHAITSRSRSIYAMTDDQLKAVSSNGGVVGIMVTNTTGEAGNYGDLRTYCDHVEYAAKIAGPEHVGLGPDFYDYFMDQLVVEYPGTTFLPVPGLEDHSKLAAVISELSGRGLSDNEIRMITRDNFARVLRDVVG
jgi:membrane dipeptidase